MIHADPMISPDESGPSVPLANGLHVVAQINYAARRPKASPLSPAVILVLVTLNLFYDVPFLIERYMQ